LHARKQHLQLLCGGEGPLVERAGGETSDSLFSRTHKALGDGR
jgi:hypothetical protein